MDSGLPLRQTIGRVQVWNVESGSEIVVGIHVKEVESVLWSADGQRIENKSLTPPDRKTGVFIVSRSKRSGRILRSTRLQAKARPLHYLGSWTGAVPGISRARETQGAGRIYRSP